MRRAPHDRGLIAFLASPAVAASIKASGIDPLKGGVNYWGTDLCGDCAMNVIPSGTAPRFRLRSIQCALALVSLLCAASLAQQDPEPALEQQSAQQARSAAERAEQLWKAGSVWHVMGLYERAIEAFRASIEIQPSAEAHTYLGWSYSHVGDIPEAIAECELAIKLDPDFGNPYNDIGVYLIEQGKLDESIPWFEKATAAKRYCCYQFPHANLGRVLLTQGKLDAAQRAFERALEHDPAYPPALIGLELIKQGQPKRL
jgi:Tfp pilus assembly protein PilF